jgi:O-antigen/teichoic acid export membrane protein
MNASKRSRLAQMVGSALFKGSALLFISTTIVNAGNYLSNLLLGRLLGPAAFADLSLVVTLILVMSFISASLTQTTAKFAAINTARNDLQQIASLRRWLARRAWAVGMIALALLVLGSPLLKTFFQTASVWPFVILGLGIPLLFAKGVEQGVLQGQTRFGTLALSYQAEMWVRLITSLLFVALGFGVNGAVAGLVLSLIATWLIARRARIGLPMPRALAVEEQRTITRFAGPVFIALIGQILINNSDILIVKHFFAPEPAGQYSALALIGRIVFFATWSVVTAMFPVAAQKKQRGEPHRHLLAASLGLVTIVSGAIIATTVVVPELIVGTLFGPAYLQIAPLVWLYAVATMLYALANVVINYRLSIGDSGGSFASMGAGIAQVVGLWLFHDSLHEVILVQIGIMAVLLVVLLIWDLWLVFTGQATKRLESSS